MGLREHVKGHMNMNMMQAMRTGVSLCRNETKAVRSRHVGDEEGPLAVRLGGTTNQVMGLGFLKDPYAFKGS